MKVAIYGQAFNGGDKEYLIELLQELQIVNASFFIEEGFEPHIAEYVSDHTYGTFTQRYGLDASFDMFVSFGGDGTMLRAVTYVKDLGIPIVGVNTGRLGFLSTFKKEDARKIVTEFVAGNYTIEERSLVEVLVNDDLDEFGNLNFAFVSTPTGSTGYSLSCGGPVIEPSAKSLVLTPIAPHNLNARPLVISDDTKIQLKVSGREENHLVSLDSRIASIPNGKEIRIQKSGFTLKMIEYKSESFLKTLRNKLLWGQDKRN